MKIVADENIPFAVELFSSLGEVHLVPGRHMKAADLVDTQALLVRSVTPVNESLIAANPIKFVGTCTIGVDHLDKEYLDSKDILFHSAPGCNALGVVQYVFSVLATLGKLNRDNKIGIIGCGNVGGRLYRRLKALGFECVCIDPHKTTAELPDLAEFESIYDCDVICMHTPRIKVGRHPTEGLLGYDQFCQIKPGALLLNAGRGECINNDELLKYMQTHDDLSVVLDVWAGEPDILVDLFPYVKFGTPHIAGYSYEGRVNGSTMIFTELARFMGKSEAWIDTRLISLRDTHFGPPQAISDDSLSDLVLQCYDVNEDHKNLAAVLDGLPRSFDLLRKNYPKRREFGHYKASLSSASMTEETYTSSMLTALGFASGE